MTETGVVHTQKNNMKKFIILTAIAVVGLLTVNNVQASFTSTNALLAQIKLTALVQGSVISQTNGTKVTETLKTTTVKVTNQDILNLLSTEFGQNFDGDQLAYDFIDTGFVVTDANGNVIKDVSTNLTDSSYYFGITNFTDYGYLQSLKVVQDTNTMNATESGTIYESDESIRYADGNGNDFHVTGLIAAKLNAVAMPPTTLFKSVTFDFKSVQGGGTFFNPNDSSYDEAVFTGQVKLTGKNVSQSY